MQLRNAETRDLPLILNIMNDAILNTTAVYDYHARSAEFVAQWFEKKQQDGMPIIVCETTQGVVGYGTYGVFRPWHAYQYSVEHSIYMDKNFRGQGLGGKLLQHLITLATESDFHTMVAGIDAENVKSLTFHENHGFKEVGRIREVGFKFGRWLDLVFMQRMLVH